MYDDKKVGTKQINAIFLEVPLIFTYTHAKLKSMVLLLQYLLLEFLFIITIVFKYFYSYYLIVQFYDKLTLNLGEDFHLVIKSYNNKLAIFCLIIFFLKIKNTLKFANNA